MLERDTGFDGIPLAFAEGLAAPATTGRDLKTEYQCEGALQTDYMRLDGYQVLGYSAAGRVPTFPAKTLAHCVRSTCTMCYGHGLTQRSKC